MTSHSSHTRNSREALPARRGGIPGSPPAPPFRGGPRGHMFAMPTEKARDFKGTLVKLATYLFPYRWTILLVGILAIGSTLFAILGPKILGSATTALFEGIFAKLSGSGDVPFARIGQILLTALGLYLLSASLAYLQGWLMTDVALRITYQLREEVMAKIHRMPFGFFDGTQHGEVLSLLTNDVDTINQTLNQSLTQILTSLVTVVGVLGMMLSISWQMTLVALFIIPLTMGLVIVVIRQSQRFFREQQDFLGHVNAHVEEMFAGHLVIKAYGGEEKSIAKFHAYNETLFGSAWKAQFFSGIMMPLMRLVGNLGYVVVVILGGWLAIRRMISVGDIQAFIQYINTFNQPIMQLANISNILQSTVAAAERLFTFLEHEEESREIGILPLPSKVKGEVEFRQVYFGYEANKPIIKGFSAHIQAGQKVAIVGPTGAGKTTLVKLLMRFYEIDQGAILIDGVDIRHYRRDDLRRMFAMVLQDTWLFNGTILENIRYGRPEASDSEVIAAAQAAHVDHFILTLPEGYHFVINEEATNLSEGQKQLLTIARAFLANAPMLILDEATSSVDTHTELLIQKAMDKLMLGRTSFIIAHRLSTIRNADLILVMREGNIVEQGKHEELLARNGFYAELYNSQFEKMEAVELKPSWALG